MVAKVLTTAAAMAVLSMSAAQAQVGRAPAEIPPASYTQSQYVDSNGCVFIRAGFNGSTTWVPRFGDDRRPMCGFEPSLGGGAGMQTAQAPMQAQPMQPAPVTVAAAAPATPRRSAPVVLNAGATRIPFSVPPEAPNQRPALRTPAPEARVYQAQAAGNLDTRWSFYDQTGPSPCTNYSAHSQMYAVPSPARPDLPLRCGPQAEHPADALNAQSPNGGRWEPWDGANPYPAPNNNVYMLPPPYAPRWPQPYLQGASQQRTAPAPVAPPRATVSTMGTTRAADAPRVGAGRMTDGQYVQVGTFGVDANARATVRRLQASGMQVATGRVTQGGQAMQVVLAGPFTSQAALNAALGSARQMGFADAFVR